MRCPRSMTTAAQALRRSLAPLALLTLTLGGAAPVQADIAASGPGGFVLKIETTIAAAPDDVFGRLLHDRQLVEQRAHLFGQLDEPEARKPAGRMLLRAPGRRRLRPAHGRWNFPALARPYA